MLSNVAVGAVAVSVALASGTCVRFMGGSVGEGVGAGEQAARKMIVSHMLANAFILFCSIHDLSGFSCHCESSRSNLIINWEIAALRPEGTMT